MLVSQHNSGIAINATSKPGRGPGEPGDNKTVMQESLRLIGSNPRTSQDAASPSQIVAKPLSIYSNAQDVLQKRDSTEAASVGQQSTTEHSTTTRVTRRKISGRGKPCIVCIPRRAYKSPTVVPLSVEEWDAILSTVQRASAIVDTANLEVTSRQMPLEESHLASRTSIEHPTVSFPDMKRWDIYMSDLIEARLEALGVSPAQDGPSRSSSASLFAELHLSPVSAASPTKHRTYPAPFAPTTPVAPSSSVSFPPAIVSQGRPGHMSRHSTFVSPMTQSYVSDSRPAFPATTPLDPNLHVYDAPSLDQVVPSSTEASLSAHSLPLQGHRELSSSPSLVQPRPRIPSGRIVGHESRRNIDKTTYTPDDQLGTIDRGPRVATHRLEATRDALIGFQRDGTTSIALPAAGSTRDANQSSGKAPERLISTLNAAAQVFRFQPTEVEIEHAPQRIDTADSAGLGYMVRLSRKSKAVPIVRPDSPEDLGEVIGEVDENARIIQDDARRERGRIDMSKSLHIPSSDLHKIQSKSPLRSASAHVVTVKPMNSDKENAVEPDEPSIVSSSSLNERTQSQKSCNVEIVPSWHDFDAVPAHKGTSVLGSQPAIEGVSNQHLLPAAPLSDRDLVTSVKNEAAAALPEAVALVLPETARASSSPMSNVSNELDEVDAEHNFHRSESQSEAERHSRISRYLGSPGPATTHSATPALSTRAVSPMPAYEAPMDFPALTARSSPHRSVVPRYDPPSGHVPTAEKNNHSIYTSWLREQMLENFPIRKLNSSDEPPVSDWEDEDDFEEKEIRFSRRKGLAFDRHIKELITGVFKEHLLPLQESLGQLGPSLQASIARHGIKDAVRPDHAASLPLGRESDADDEDDEIEIEPLRPSRMSGAGAKTIAEIRNVVLEALRDFKALPTHRGQSLNTTTISAAQHLQVELETERTLRQEAEDDLAAERAALEKAELEISRSSELVTLSEQEIALFKESTNEADVKMDLLSTEVRTAHQRLASLQNAESDLKLRCGDLEEDNAGLEDKIGMLQRTNLELGDNLAELEADKEALLETEVTLREQVAAFDVRHESSLRRMAHLQESMAAADAEHVLHKAHAERDLEVRQSLVSDLETARLVIQRLESQLAERSTSDIELIRSTVIIEETRRANAALESKIAELREENFALRAGSSITSPTSKTLPLDNDRECQPTTARVAQLETRLELKNAELEDFKQHHSSIVSRWKCSVDEVVASRQLLLQETMTAERKRHDSALQHLDAQHSRLLQNALEDNARAEAVAREKVDLVLGALQLEKSKVAHLDAKIDVLQAAAHAAAVAARSSVSSSRASSTTFSGPQAQGQVEAGSPHALRESIAILQAQLRDREDRIDMLTADITTANDNLRSRGAEAIWLRELLSLRTDDLADLCRALTALSFDREAARDAAVRLSTGLKMDLARRKRARIGEVGSKGGRDSEELPNTRDSAIPPVVIPVPTLQEISAFATPKAAQFAAALGNWRKMKPAELGPSAGEEQS
ncbi:hypothetical protein MRB53_037337 [Persea americana]|nr:hypothetical protein MRB53_037337 [Persea americana]